MKVELELDVDVVVCESNITVLDEDRDEPCDRRHVVQIAQQGGEGDVFVLVWTTHEADVTKTSWNSVTSGPSIMWRGDWRSTLSEFDGIVRDLIHDKDAGAGSSAAS
jgi:hypothetical protein